MKKTCAALAVLALVVTGAGQASAKPLTSDRLEDVRPPCLEQDRGSKRAADKPEKLASGGEWTSLNGDLANTRSQAAETRIGVQTASALRPAWSFDSSTIRVTGGMRSTPVVSGGCVFLAFGQGYLGERGDVVALDAETGALIWHTELAGSVLGLAVADGLVYATPSLGTRGEDGVVLPVVTDSYQPAGSFAVALDASTGDVRWTSERLDDGKAANGTFINASPVVFRAGGRRMVFVPLSGGSGDGAMVPMYFLDALTGVTIKRALGLTPQEYAQGFGGPGIWSTAAFDEATGHLYAGTADSEGHTRQHPYNNALLRIDADPRRATFGTVVDHYSGTTEHADQDALIGSQNNPACGPTVIGDVDVPTFFDTSSSPECLELDLDFGASPNLFRAADGELVVAAMQKSGVFHAVNADSMERRWQFYAGPGGPAMHSATAAVDGTGIHVGATPNLVFDLDRDSGAVDWASTSGFELFAYQPISVANGVVYAINDMGQLIGLTAADGLPVLQRDLALDGGFGNCLGVGAGVAIAAHTVFAPCDAGGTVDLAGIKSNAGGLVAYRLPA